MRNPVTTRKLKFDGSAKAPWLGDLVEQTGDWLVVYFVSPAHTTGRGAGVAHALRYFSLSRPLSVLVCFDASGNVLEYQCDAGLPATLAGRTIDFVDLDLDVMAFADGTRFVRDHETFARNSATMSYTREAIAAAHEGVGLAMALLDEGASPFNGDARALLGRVLASQGPL